MIEKKQNEPKLRFLAFDGDWKLKNVEKLFERVKNPVKVIGNQEYQQIGIRSHGKGIFYKEKVSGNSLGNKAVFWIEPNVFIVNIVFAWERAVAITSENEVGMIASHRFPMYKPKEGLTALKFILYFFKTQRGNQLLIDASPGGAGRNKTLGQKEFGIQKLYLPEYSEQEKIGNFFSKLDQRIEIEEKKLSLLQEQKKGYMKKLFNQELSFKDQEGNDYPNWRKVTLDEICLYKSSSISLSSFKEYNGEKIYPLYDANSMVLNIDKYDQENNYVSIIKDGAGAGRIRYCEGKSSVLGTMGYLLPKDTVYIHFLYFRLQIINFLSYVSGSTIPHIYFKDYKKENIGLPCEDEQKKISNFLSMLEKNVEKSKKKIELLKRQKEGLMQQMFI